MSTFKQIYDEYEQTFRQQLLDKLYELSPYDFEHFARKLLDAYGFVEVEVTQASKDGGIDGRGNLKLGLATMRAAFQCKRWQGNVGRVEVDKFRGAIQGEFEQGIFFTTGDYTEGAKKVSLKRGAVPIILLNGDSIVDLMIEKELGVERVPLYIFRECLSDFMVEEGEVTTHQIEVSVGKTKSVTGAETEELTLPENYTGHSITAFLFDGVRHEVQSWIQMLARLCELVHAKHEKQFEQVLNFVGKKRPYFTRKPEELRQATEIGKTGVFLEKNLSTLNIVNLSRKVISLFEYNESDLTFETQEKL